MLTPGGAGKGILPIMGLTIPENGSVIDGLAGELDSIVAACFAAFFFEVAIGFPFNLGQIYFLATDDFAPPDTGHGVSRNYHQPCTGIGGDDAFLYVVPLIIEKFSPAHYGALAIHHHCSRH